MEGRRRMRPSASGSSRKGLLLAAASGEANTRPPVSGGARDKPSVALKPGLHPVQPAFSQSLAFSDGLITEPPLGPELLPGLFTLLPDEILEIVLKHCTPLQLGMLQTTCTYFRDSRLISTIAKHRLRAIPRARELKPRRSQHETHLALLHFINHQSAAAAQATAIACGSHHTSALFLDHDAASSCVGHSLYMFGRNLHGCLGLADFEDRHSPAVVALGFRPSQDNNETEEEVVPSVVACGAHHSACIARRGELFTWGLCKSGELGHHLASRIEVPAPRRVPPPPMRVVTVVCGDSHTLAIGDSGSLWSCGRNGSGQLGLGHLLDSLRLQMVQKPAEHQDRVCCGRCPALRGPVLRWVAVHLGDGSRGQLGHVSLQVLGAAGPGQQPQSIKLLLPQKILRLDPGKLPAEHRITTTAAGSFHTMALTVGGAIVAFGANDSGCLGLGDFIDRWKPTKVNLALEGEESICLRAVQFACGAQHTVALVSKQGCMEVRAAGANKWGQLGLGDRKTRERFALVARLAHVTAVRAGGEHSAAVTEAGALYMWGRGDSGQLGTGDARCRWRPTRVAGFAIVHPDKTLRRSQRGQLLVRPVAEAKRQRYDDHQPVM